jgi:hypothetical protein
MTATGETKASLESKLPKTGGITPELAAVMWENLGGTYPAIVALEVSERTEPADDEDKDPSVKLRVLSVELPRDNDEAEWLRELQRAWYRRRTKQNTLEDGSGSPERDAAVARAILDQSDLGAFLPTGTTVTVNGLQVETLAELASSLHLDQLADA